MTPHTLGSRVPLGTWPRVRRGDRARSPRRRRLLLAAGLLAIAALRAPAEDALSVSVGARVGAFYGVGNEYVYAPSISSNYMISRLVWPLAPMMYSGAALSVEVAGFFATLDVRQGFAGVAGTMTDSDFLNGDGVRTHFSQSDSYAERANLLDLRAGWDFYRTDSLRVGAFGAFSYMDLKWSARDGYYQYPPPQSSPPYPPWSSSETKVPLYGTDIIYETAYAGGSIGVRVRWGFADAFALDGSFAFTPILGCSTEDNHLERQLDFYSRLSGGLMIEPRLAVTYTFLSRARLRLEVGYRYAWNLKGDLTSVNTGTSDYSTSYPYAAGPNSSSTETGASGADFSALDAGLVLSISL
jgi:outer membrane protease